MADAHQLEILKSGVQAWNGWREQIMEYNILDFSNWKDDAEFGRKFGKLVEGLDLFYKE